jgi:hypothetical protein
MSKKRLLTVIAVLAILLVTLAVVDPVMDALASDSESEPKVGALPGANPAGMAIYQQSERADYGRFTAKSNAEGWATYYESERGSNSIGSAVSNEEGLAIYHQSERHGAAAPPQRLFNGKPFNAYQRSEWLGAER